jgi:hypothetical protein
MFLAVYLFHLKNHQTKMQVATFYQLKADYMEKTVPITVYSYYIIVADYFASLCAKKNTTDNLSVIREKLRYHLMFYHH